MLDRVVEAVLIVIAIRSGMQALGMADTGGLSVLRGEIRRRCVPVSALVVTASLAAGALLPVMWTGAQQHLARTSGGGWWRTLTAPFVQGSGVLGAAFNVVTALMVLALAEWLWGGGVRAGRGAVLAVGTWLVGAWAPVGSAAAIAGYHVSERHVEAYSYGSSGATYFVAGALCAALVLTGRGRARLLGLVGPLAALAAAVVLGDGHGVLLDAGFVLAIGVSMAVELVGRVVRSPRVFLMRASDFSQPRTAAHGRSEG